MDLLITRLNLSLANLTKQGGRSFPTSKYMFKVIIQIGDLSIKKQANQTSTLNIPFIEIRLIENPLLQNKLSKISLYYRRYFLKEYDRVFKVFQRKKSDNLIMVPQR
jgi:hypothetical protein